MAKSPRCDDAIFVHSSFRTSSTWIWARFRAAPETLAYYEYFNEALGHLTQSDVASAHHDTWRSRHPTASPYFVEFLPLLHEGRGVEGFKASMSIASFVPPDGYGGALPEDQKAYVGGLIDHAREMSKRAVLTCTRSLGRVRALKTGLGGVHLVLRRRLFHQWASYSGQAATGNAYFLETVFETVAANLHDPFLAFLDDFVRTRETYRADSPTRGLPDDEIFSVMIALHVYLTLRALPDTDLMIATSDLHDAAYRAEVVRELHALTGLNIDLADAQERIDLPRAPIADLDQTRLNTEALCGRALREVGGGAAEAALCDRMLQEVWTDVRLWTLHTEAPRQQLEAARRKLAELGAGGGDAAALADAQARIAGLMDVLAATERAGKEEAARRRLADAARGAAEAAQAQAQDTLRARDETIRTLIAERDEAARLEEARREVVALTLRNQQLEERVQDLLFAVEHYKAGQGIFKRRGKRDESEPR